MRRLFPLVLVVLAAGPSSQRAADGDADDKAIRDLTQRFFAAYASKDLDAFMALWSEKSPEYDGHKEGMTELFAETGPITLKRLTVVRVRRDGDAALVRVRVELAGDDAKTGEPHPALGALNRVLSLVRENGKWQVMRYGSTGLRLIDVLMAAKSKQERLGLLDEDQDLVGANLVRRILNNGAEEAKAGRFTQASRFQDVAFEVAEGLGDKTTLAWCYQSRGLCLSRQAHHEPALSAFQTALRLFREANNREGESETLNCMGAAYLETGRYEEASHQFRDSLKIARELEDRVGEAVALNNLGEVCRETGRYAEALQQYQDSLKIERELEDRAGEAQTLNNLGIVYKDMGRYGEALQQYQDSLKIERDLEDRVAEATTLNNLGIVYQHTGHYADALQLYQDSLQIQRERGDRKGEARSLSEMGSLYGITGLYAEALRQLQASLQIDRDLGDRKGEATSLNNLGAVNRLAGHYADALQSYQDSLKIDCSLEDRAGQAASLNNIGIVYEAAGLYADALRQFQGSLQISCDLRNKVGELRTLSNMGNVYKETGRYPEALQQYQDGLKIARSLDDAEAIVACQSNLGRMRQKQKQWREAVGAYLEAVNDTERLRANMREPSLQSSLLAQKIAPYFWLTECRLELGERDEAFTTGERMKARGLVDMLQRGKADLRRGMSDDERKQEQGLQDQVTAISVQRENLQSRHADKDVQDAAQRDLTQARQDLEDFHRALYLHRPDLATRRAEFAPVSLKELSSSFAGRPGLVVLSYLVGDEETLLFVLTAAETNGGPALLTIHRLDVGSKDLAEAVDAFRAACSDPGKGEPDAEDLYRWLIAPAADQLADAKQLVVIPDGVLHTLPFQALKDSDGKYLIERFAVSYAPSVTALTKMEALGATRRQEYVGKAATLLAIGVSDFGRRERPLPAAEQEAQAVADAFGDGAKLLPGKEATRAKLEASWAGRRYLHFATHGRLNSDAPLYSSLVLSSSGDGDEGVLYAQELVDGAEIPAELAVMSACQTGLGKHVNGEGLQGLSWAWFTAGVPSTVASQWSVGDDSTARLMKVFYAGLKADDTKAEALRQAALALLQDDATRHPFYWAPFVLVGDDR